jgi:hypothetical protein
MAAGNEGRSRDQGRHQNGGLDRGLRDSIGNAGQRVQQGGEAVSRHLQEGAETVRDELGRQYRRAETAVATNPMSSLLLGFGLGFGLGLVVTSMLGERERDTWAGRHLPDRLRRMPDSLHDSLEQLADSVRRLPETIRGHLPGTLTRS